MIIKGQNFRLLVGGSTVAEATSCTVTITGQTEDSSTKDTTGDFSVNRITSRSWTASVDTFDESDIPTLLGIIIAKQPVTIAWDNTTGNMNSVAQGAAFKRTGQAYLSDLNIVATNRQNTTITAQFTGKGKLQ